MTLATISKRLITYLTAAEENKVKAIYTLLKEDIEDNQQFKFTDEEFAILKHEQELHLAGKSKSYNRQKAMEIIRGQKGL
ncbi:hypothetical protein [Mucilaginibacter sp.]